MSAGVLSGLQNQYGGLRASWVGSIPTYSRQYSYNRPFEKKVFIYFWGCYKIILNNLQGICIINSDDIIDVYNGAKQICFSIENSKWKLNFEIKCEIG